MGSQKLFAALEGDALSVIHLLNEETENLDRNELSEFFDSCEQKCSQVLDDIYVAMRLNRFTNAPFIISKAVLELRIACRPNFPP
jgi:hypothetical protein